MFERSAWVVAVFGAVLCGPIFGAEDAKVTATGEWSKPVIDSLGAAVRGRLVICELPRKDKLRETPVYVELQDVSEARGRSLQLFCDMGKRNSRPEYKGRLHCELRDKDKRLIETTSSPFGRGFGGEVPGSEWVTLPSDATIRLRATPFGISHENALTICPQCGLLWVITDDDTNEYFLSGTFTVNPAEDAAIAVKDRVWRGTIDLPVVTIVNARGAQTTGDKPKKEDESGQTRSPSLTLKKAVALAEAYAEPNCIELSKHHLASVRLVHKADTDGKFIWEVTWDTGEEVSDDEVELIVEMNESVSRRFRG